MSGSLAVTTTTMITGASTKASTLLMVARQVLVDMDPKECVRELEFSKSPWNLTVLRHGSERTVAASPETASLAREVSSSSLRLSAME